MKNLQLLNKVLNPAEINSLEEYGEEELRQLTDLYGQENGVLDPNRAKEDYYQLKVVLKSLNCSLPEACSIIMKNYKDIFPDFAMLSAIVSTDFTTHLCCL